MEWIDQYVRRGRRELEELGRKAEAAARRVPAPVVEAALRSLPGGPALYTAQALLPKPQKPGVGQRQEPALKRAPVVAQKKAAPATRAHPAAKPPLTDLFERLDNSPTAKYIAGLGAQHIARPIGAVRGLVNMAEDAVDTAVFAARMSPFAQIVSLPGQSARDELGRAVVNTLEAAGEAIARPDQALENAGRGLRRFREKHDSTATPQAKTIADEIVRNAEIGANQGELAVDIVSMVRGGPVTRRISRIGRRAEPDDWVSHGIPIKRAKYYAQDYDQKGKRRQGHHSIIPQRAKLPKILGGGPYPKFILDHPLNVVKFEGKSIGRAFREHAGLDPFFRGGKVPLEFGGGGWSAKRDGFKRFGAPQRIWYGTPEAMKDLIGGGLLAPVVLNDEEEQQAAWGLLGPVSVN